MVGKMGGKNLDSNLWDFHQVENRKHLDESLPRQRMIYKKVLKYLKKNNSKIAEIGFGNGYLLSLLIKKYNYVYGLDISEKNIKITKKRFKKVIFKLIKDDGKLPFKDNELDCFIASEVIEHMNDKELITFKKELKRVLKKGGIFIGTVPANENLKDNYCYCPNCGTEFHKWGHKQSFSYKRLLKEFNNLQKVSIKYYFNRYQGDNIIEKFLGYIFYLGRRLASNFVFIKSAGYLFIFRK